MTTLTTARVAPPLAPITAVLRAVRARRGAAAVHGVAPGLLVLDPAGWTPASALLDPTSMNGPALGSSALDAVLSAARRRWGAGLPAAAALAWKSYTFWLALPAVIGWAAARRVPSLHPSNVLLRFSDHQPFVTVGLLQPSVTVLPTDPLATAGHAGVRVVADEADLLAAFRATLLDAHLAPMLDRIRSRVRVGHRTLLGSVASAVAYSAIRASDELPGSTIENAGTLLDTLGVDDLVSLTPGDDGDLVVQRRTCCLAFTLPQPKVCSGCCIRTAG